MSGIAGICRRDGRPIPEHWVVMLDDSIARRGVDATGRFHDHVDGVEILMLHHRVGVIDLAGSEQPMVSYNKEIPEMAMVFDGCIYNNAQLRNGLQSLGVAFASDHSDTESIFKAFEQWGDLCTDYLDGMYAVAMWDRRTLELSLFRDPYGQKPLYVLDLAEAGDGCVFCSNPAPLQKIAHELGLKSTSTSALQRYLQLGYLTGSETLIQPIENVSRKIMTLQPTNETVEGAIRGSVIDHLESDVPLGCFLSGGVDSSLIAAFAQQELGNLQTYCVKMDDPAYDESSYALEVAKHLGTVHQTLRVSMEPAEDVISLTAQLGQPFADSSILPMYWMSQAARKEVTVALSGNGGDELFLGSNKYLEINTISRWHALLARVPWRRKSTPESMIGKLGKMADVSRDWSLCNVASVASIFSRNEIELLTREPFDHAVTPELQDSPISRLQQFDIEHYLPCDLLRNVDVASMAVALEVRSPLLSMRVRNAVAPLSTRELLVGGRKGLLRSIAKNYLPGHIVNRPKMGFGVPLAHWLRSEQSSLGKLASDVLLSTDPFSGLNINKQIVVKMLQDHRAGKRNHGHKLFALLTLALWSQQAQAS